MRRRRLGDHATLPGLAAEENAALTAEFAVEAARTLQERHRHDRLTALSLPLIQIDFDAGGIDEAAISGIAAQLSDRLPLEVS